MADMPEPTSSSTPQLGWCLALYPRLSRRARRRMAALVVAAALLAQPLAGYARDDREAGAAGGNFRAPIVQHGPPTLPVDALPGGSDVANPYANPAVARALSALGLDAPDAPSALDATPAGSQFQVNTYTTNDQRRPSVATDADGDFVVVWQSYGSGGTDAERFSIQGQRYNAAGSPQGSQFQVNTYTTNNQFFPQVATDADGDFVVAWQSLGSGGTDSSDESIHGQRYDAAGSAVGSQFQVNTYTTSFQRLPSVAMDADGDFVVVWYSYGSAGTDTNAYSIQGQRFTAAGGTVGSQFQVNTYTTNSQFGPSVAMDADGDFVVVWQSSGSGGTDSSDDSIQGQTFDAGGSAVGSQFQVNSYTTSFQRLPSMAMDADGAFVVVWQSTGSGGTDTGGDSIQAQRYLSANPPAPTAVDLRYFRAIGLSERAILVWETASEADTLGFQVLRAADPGGPWTPVGPALIPAEGGAAAGRSYVLRDAPGPGAWHYRLEDVGADGKRTSHPAADVRVGPGAEGRELFVPSAETGR